MTTNIRAAAQALLDAIEATPAIGTQGQWHKIVHADAKMRAALAEPEPAAADVPVFARGIQEWSDSPACAGLLLVLQRDHLAAMEAMQEEVERLKDDLAGQRGVFVAWAKEALLTLETIDPDDLEDCGPQQQLIDTGRKLAGEA